MVVVGAWDPQASVAEGRQHGVPCQSLHGQVREQETRVVARAWEAWERQASAVGGRQNGVPCLSLHGQVREQETEVVAKAWEAWECQVLEVEEY